ncbi:hypothetical protein JCM8097_005666 [Rhodosporidiobolus ruineniae]
MPTGTLDDTVNLGLGLKLNAKVDNPAKEHYKLQWAFEQLSRLSHLLEKVIVKEGVLDTLKRMLGPDKPCKQRRLREPVDFEDDMRNGPVSEDEDKEEESFCTWEGACWLFQHGWPDIKQHLSAGCCPSCTGLALRVSSWVLLGVILYRLFRNALTVEAPTVRLGTDWPFGAAAGRRSGQRLTGPGKEGGALSLESAWDLIAWLAAKADKAGRGADDGLGRLMRSSLHAAAQLSSALNLSPTQELRCSSSAGLPYLQLPLSSSPSGDAPSSPFPSPAQAALGERSAPSPAPGLAPPIPPPSQGPNDVPPQLQHAAALQPQLVQQQQQQGGVTYMQVPVPMMGVQMGVPMFVAAAGPGGAGMGGGAVGMHPMGYAVPARAGLAGGVHGGLMSYYAAQQRPASSPLPAQYTNRHLFVGNSPCGAKEAQVDYKRRNKDKIDPVSRE